MKRIFLILSFVGVFIISWAQKPVNNPYSRYGLGMLMYQGYGRNLAMGRTGEVNFSPYYVSKLNPASYGALSPQHVLFSFSIDNRLSLLSNTDTSLWTNVSEINHIMAGIPINKTFAISFGVGPYSGVGYLFQSSDSLYDDLSGTNVLTQYEGNGGISEFYVGASVRPFSSLSLGANFYTRWGNLNRETVVQILESDFESSTFYSNDYRMLGFGADFGFIFADTIKTKDGERNFLEYRLGATYTPPSSLHGLETFFIRKKTRYYSNDFTDTLQNDTLNRFSIDLAQGFSVGLALKFYDKLEFEFNYSKKYWEGIDILDGGTLRNSESFALGMEYCRDFNSTRFWRKLAWRAGGYYNNTYWTINNTPITDYGITFGVGIPTRTTIINFSFDLGVLGTTQNNLVQEKYFLFNVDLNMIDVWFIKRKFL